MKFLHLTSDSRESLPCLLIFINMAVDQRFIIVLIVDILGYYQVGISPVTFLWL